MFIYLVAGVLGCVFAFFLSIQFLSPAASETTKPQLQFKEIVKSGKGLIKGLVTEDKAQPSPDSQAPEAPSPDSQAPDLALPPEAPSPDSQAPDLALPPEAPSPDSQAPEAPSPDSQAPEAPSPDSQAPEAPSPDSQAPDLALPPEAPSPDSQAPEAPSPDSQAPEAPSPDSQAPDLALPPEAPSPDSQAPEAPSPEGIPSQNLSNESQDTEADLGPDSDSKTTNALNQTLTDLKSFMAPYIYEPSNRPDPFEDPTAQLFSDTTPLALKTPPEEYSLEQIKLKGIIWDTKIPRALFKLPNQEDYYTLSRGAKIGKNGIIFEIREDEVVILETALKKRGSDENQTRIIKILRLDRLKL